MFYRCLVHLVDLLLSCISRVQLCATPETAAHQAPPSLGFSRQEHWSGLPFISPMHESEKCKWSHSVVSNFSRPHGLQPTRLLCPWDFPGKSTGGGAIAFFLIYSIAQILYFLFVISMIERIILRSPTIIVWLSYVPFNFVMFYFVYFGVSIVRCTYV